MKNSLLILTLLAFALAACSKKSNEEQDEYVKRKQEERRLNHADFAHRAAMNTEVGYYTLYKFCIDGVTYLAHGQNLILARSAEDKPIECKVDKDENE